MALAPMLIASPEYYEFHRKAIIRGERVIVDNGAYEETPVKWDTYITLLKDLRPYEYVVPDKIRDPAETRKMWDDFPLLEIRGVFVLHSEEKGYPFPQGIGTLAIPKWMGVNRTAVISNLRTRPIHALGFIDGASDAECKELVGLGVRSIDSSEPFRNVSGISSSSFKEIWQQLSAFRWTIEHTSRLVRYFSICQAKEYTMGVEDTTQAEVGQTTGAKRDEYRLRYDLIPKFFIDELASIFEEGLRYGQDNWKKGGEEFVADLINHVEDHYLRYTDGDRSEKHLAKVAWNALARAWYDAQEKEKK